jgi:hypothetical protein
VERDGVNGDRMESGKKVGDEVFPHFPPHVFAGISLRGRMSGGPWLTDKTQWAADLRGFAQIFCG